MRTRTKALLTLALLATVAVPLAAARRPAPGAGGLLERAAQRLDLTAEQKSQIRDIFAAHKTEVEAELLAIKTAREAMWVAIHAENPSEAAIRGAANAVGKAEGELGVTRARIVQEVRPGLTPEQQAELQQMLADFRAFAQTFFERLREHVDSALGG
ncbi:MAG TPA: Spy/CpxP family protein refolding chaperone [Thermoanaerobaculia bacterium]|jgi:Spy/CpxP family protein refolding chaperone|nr:Spy/CpxP family protein refolding chaperone [Thermoanaerobaculia bacterium]